MWTMKNTTDITPAALPPDGVQANFESPQDGYYPLLLTTAIVCTVVVNLSFLVNAYVKLVVKDARLLVEDWFCIASWFFVNGFFALTLGIIYYGEGHMVWEMKRESYRHFLKFLYMSTTIYSPAAFFTKVTLLLLIARVFSVHPTVGLAIRGFIILIFLAYLPLQFLKIFVCKPMWAIATYWNDFETDSDGMATGRNANCRNQTALFMGDTIISVITDAIILVLPIPLARRMQAPRWQKIKIMILLGAGGAATLTTAVRIWLNVILMHSTNIPLDIALPSFTCMLELSIGLLCACVPSANLLLERWLARARRRGRRRARRRRGMMTGGAATGTGTATGTATGTGTGTAAADRSSSSTWGWTPLKRSLVTSTLRTLAQQQQQQHPRADGRESRAAPRSYADVAGDAEAAAGDAQLAVPEVFNNRLDMPSIGSTTCNTPRLSREDGHGGLEDGVCEAALESDGVTAKGPSYGSLARKESLMEYESFMSKK